MLVPESIERSFREHLLTLPYDRITISGICTAANVARTLFYTYYNDKDDLLEKIINKDIVQPLVDLQELLPPLQVKSAPQLIVEKMFLSVLERRELYSRINAINNHTNLIQALTNRCIVLSNRVLKDAKIPETEKAYLSFITASSQALLISKWIERGYDVSPKEMARYSRRWIMDSWKPHFDLEYSLTE